ncbi:FAD binding domain-containing protein, partial [Acinetobacter baumannii]
MKPFDYLRVASPDRAVAAMGEGQPRFIAGGTNLLDLMKLQIETPDKLVDISRLALSDIEDTADGGLLIGAMVTN